MKNNIKYSQALHPILDEGDVIGILNTGVLP